jgi:hypothetical protein
LNLGANFAPHLVYILATKRFKPNKPWNPSLVVTSLISHYDFLNFLHLWFIDYGFLKKCKIACNNFLTKLFLSLSKCIIHRNKHNKTKIKLGDRLSSIEYGELRFAFLRKGLVATKDLKKKEIENLSKPKRAPLLRNKTLKQLKYA